MAEVKRLQFAEGVTITAPTGVQSGPYVDFTWTADATEMDVDVSGVCADAREPYWGLSKPSGHDYEQVLATITKPSATNVRIVVEAALSTGTYRLSGT